MEGFLRGIRFERQDGERYYRLVDLAKRLDRTTTTLLRWVDMEDQKKIIRGSIYVTQPVAELMKEQSDSRTRHQKHTRSRRKAAPAPATAPAPTQPLSAEKQPELPEIKPKTPSLSKTLGVKMLVPGLLGAVATAKGLTLQQFCESILAREARALSEKLAAL